MISILLLTVLFVLLAVLKVKISVLDRRFDHIEQALSWQGYADIIEKVIKLESELHQLDAYTDNLKEYVLADETIPLKVKVLNPEAKIPVYAKEGDSGMDISAIQDYTIDPGRTILVETGLAFSTPSGYELQVRPRSGVSLKTMLRVANSPGTVDSSFRGQVCVIVTNFGNEPFLIEKGYRIAQIVLAKVAKADLQIVEELDQTDRAEGGFGSTGVK